MGSGALNPPGPFPFAIGRGAPFQDGQPWLGGRIRILTGPISGNANYQLATLLGGLARFVWVLDAGTLTTFTNPLPRGSTAWDNNNVYLNLPAIGSGHSVVFFIA